LNSFSFVIHPIDPRVDVQRKYPFLGRALPLKWIHFLSRFFPPLYISQITGLRSPTGAQAEGWLVACPFTPQRMMSLSTAVAYRKIVRTGQLAKKLGAGILGLGAFTHVVGDAGMTIASQLDIPVTTGGSYTVAMAVQAAHAAAERLDLSLPQATIAVVGAAGAIGRVSARLMARECARMILIGLPRNVTQLETVKASIEAERGAQTWLTTDSTVIRQADIVLTVTSSLTPVIEPQHLKPGAIVLDVARPRNVSRRVAAERDDVLVIEGGMVAAPGSEMDFGFDFGFPPCMAYACMAEVMILALEGRYESYTLGRDITVDQVQEIHALGVRHGFKLGGFRSFERAVTDCEIERVREAARQRLTG
jgi:predicted amino acid dehydrogenase